MRLMILATADVQREVPAAGRYQLNHLFEFREETTAKLKLTHERISCTDYQDCQCRIRNGRALSRTRSSELPLELHPPEVQD